MSALRLGTQVALCAGLGLIFVGCGSPAAEETSGGAGSNVPLIDNFPGSAGQSADVGSKGWARPISAGSGGASAGTLAAVGGSSGSAGRAPAAGSSGAAGVGGGTAGAAAAGSGTSAAPDPLDVFGAGSAGAAADDPFAIFDPSNAAPVMISCTGLICSELADCQSLYPTEHVACKFTSCVDFECK